MSTEVKLTASVRRGRWWLVIILVLAIASAGTWFFATRHAARTGGPVAATTGTWYISPMHPWIISPTPGTCPICGQDLVPIDPRKFAGEIDIDPVMVQNMGIRTAAVERAAVVRSVRTVGMVAIDEALVSDVHLKLAGWVENLHVETLWASVRAGEPLFDLYAPDLYAAQQEYLLALTNRGSLHGDELLTAARTRLHFFDIGDAAIAALEKAGVPSRTMTITSPRAGVVAVKDVNVGTYAMPGMTTMRIADLSTVWIDAVVYEHQLDPALIRVGQAATIVPALPAADPIVASIDYVYPTIDPRLREIRVRLVVDNRANLLKPGMFATVTITQSSKPQLLVPREAVVGTGERHIAFVVRGEGHFEPRNVRLGRATDDGRVVVLAGLADGDRVVTSGEFLLDSETRMREGLAKLMATGLAAVPATHPVPAMDNALPAPAMKTLPGLLEAYAGVQVPLSAGTLDPARGASPALVQALVRFTAAGIGASPHFVHRNPEVEAMRDAAHAMVAANDLPGVRVAFGRFSANFIDLLRRSGVTAVQAARLHPFICGMYKAAPRGGVWLQQGDTAHNPFLGGTRMESCSTADAPLPVVGAIPTQVPVPAGTPAPVPHPTVQSDHHR